MKFVVSSSTMLTRLQAVSKVINGNSVQRILDNILLVAADGVLYATGSDSETTMESRIRLESMEEEGRIAVSARLLLDILKEFPEQPLTFDINTTLNEVKIISEKGELTVPGECADDYPERTGLKESVAELTTKCGIMLDGIVKTIFATVVDDIRPVMSCILLEMKEDRFTFVASDGQMLVRYNRFDARSENGQFSLLLQKKPALTLKSVLPKDDSELRISFNDKMVCFIFDDYKVTCTLAEGRFPNYNSVIPKNNPKKLIIERTEFYNSLRRVSIMANKASSLVKFDVSDGKIDISARDIDYSTSGHETLSCQYEGEKISIGFKSDAILEILSVIDTENFVLELSDSTCPGLFLPFENDEADEDLLILLMPLLI